jgi:hypothetical protein
LERGKNLFAGNQNPDRKSKTSNKAGATDYKNYPDGAVSEVLIKTVGGLMAILEILKNTKNNQRVFGLSNSLVL